MFGKASVFLVLGFSAIFMYYSARMSNFSTESVDVYTRYYSESIANNIANSGANIACNYIYISPAWNAGLKNVDFWGGKLNIDVESLSKNRIRITSVGTYGTFSKTVKILLQPSNYAKFGNFYNQLSAAPATGDTFSGPFHTNDWLNVYGDPVFLGKTTSKNGIKKWINPSNPKFLGGYESGVNIPHSWDPSKMINFASSGGKVFEGIPSRTFVDVDLTFNADGTVTHRHRKGQTKDKWDPWGPYITEPINTLSPNGVIFIDKGNVTMRGTVHGQVTVATSKKGGNGMGNVYIDSDIVYKDDPRTNPNSEDMLGIVCEDKIEVTFDNSRGDINIHATMFAQHDGLNIESYSSYTKINNMNILGGLIAKDTKPTASYSGGKPTKGYRFIHKFDDRFLKTVPPYFPTTGGLEIVSWLE